MRIRSKWSAKNRDRSPEEIAGVVAFISWRICTQAVLELENNDFQTDTQVQRLAIIWEFAAFLIHVTDRMMYGRMDEEERAVFISAMAKAMAQTMQDNMEDILGNGYYKPDLINTLNIRMNEYAKFSYSDESGPSFPMLRYFGETVTAVMGERQKKWVTTQIIDIEAPDAIKTLKRGISNLLPDEEANEDD
ncbi:MAG: hypothetical protein U9N50_13015 [Pseudomonadota bacterium]|nr:hypothetical protein [Pseudomonadota bacterium]